MVVMKMKRRDVREKKIIRKKFILARNTRFYRVCGDSVYRAIPFAMAVYQAEASDYAKP